MLESTRCDCQMCKMHGSRVIEVSILTGIGVILWGHGISQNNGQN